jgi:iron complex transport system ATP-binding protein
MIEIRGISKSYGATPVLDSIDLDLRQGGITSIIGPNGAGKSTLLSIISRLQPMDAGTVLIDGQPVGATPSDILARRLAILRQDNAVAARVTVRDLVSFGRYPHSKGRINAEDIRHIDQALAFTELGSLENRYLDQLSGGQRQRAFIAMILAQDTDYLLFDEPLNNLDARHALATMTLFRRIAGEFSKTVILVIHDINFAAAYSDRIIAMRDGRIHCAGTPADVIRDDVLEEIFGIEFTVHEIGGKRIADCY